MKDYNVKGARVFLNLTGRKKVGRYNIERKINTEILDTIDMVFGIKRNSNIHSTNGSEK